MKAEKANKWYKWGQGLLISLMVSVAIVGILCVLSTIAEDTESMSDINLPQEQVQNSIVINLSEQQIQMLKLAFLRSCFRGVEIMKDQCLEENERNRKSCLLKAEDQIYRELCRQNFKFAEGLCFERFEKDKTTWCQNTTSSFKCWQMAKEKINHCMEDSEEQREECLKVKDQSKKWICMEDF